MADEDRERTMQALHEAVAELEKCGDVRQRVAVAIVEALRAGNRPRDVDAVVPYDRNHVRRIAKKAGLPPLREPTVQPREKDITDPPPAPRSRAARTAPDARGRAE